MSTARCAAGRLGGIPECRPSDDIAGHVAGRRDAPLVRRRCVRASVVSTVRTQGVRASSGAIACRCCSRIAPIATWRIYCAENYAHPRGSIARIQRFAVRAGCRRPPVHTIRRWRDGITPGHQRSASTWANSASRKSMPSRSVVTWSVGTSEVFGSTSSL